MQLIKNKPGKLSLHNLVEKVLEAAVMLCCEHTTAPLEQEDRRPEDVRVPRYAGRC
jgi:hypothetical protein